MDSFNQLREECRNLSNRLARYKVEFIDQNDYDAFLQNVIISRAPQNSDPLFRWHRTPSGSSEEDAREYRFLDMAGYFDFGVADTLIDSRRSHVRGRLIPHSLKPKGNDRDQGSLQVLRKMEREGIEIKCIDRIHARLINYYERPSEEIQPIVSILGTFDFNRESLGGNRIDAGIKTENPDICRAMVNFFEKIWNDEDNHTLDERYGYERAR